MWKNRWSHCREVWFCATKLDQPLLSDKRKFIFIFKEYGCHFLDITFSLSLSPPAPNPLRVTYTKRESLQGLSSASWIQIFFFSISCLRGEANLSHLCNCSLQYRTKQRVFSWRKTLWSLGPALLTLSLTGGTLYTPTLRWGTSLSAWLSVRLSLIVLKFDFPWLVDSSLSPSPLWSFDLQSRDFPSTEYYYLCCQWLNSPMADITSHLLKVMPPTYRVVPVAKQELHFDLFIQRWDHIKHNALQPAYRVVPVAKQVLHFSPTTPLHLDVTHVWFSSIEREWVCYVLILAKPLKK